MQLTRNERISGEKTLKKVPSTRETVRNVGAANPFRAHNYTRVRAARLNARDNERSTVTRTCTPEQSSASEAA